ncbi:hypothetical protein GcM3_165018, partial [Golovinomyces cichoracearum]
YLDQLKPKEYAAIQYDGRNTPISDIQTQKSAEINVYYSENEHLPDFDMVNTQPGQGSKSHEYEKSTQPVRSFTTAGFTTYCQQTAQRTIEGKFTMENIHVMLQELYKAITEKMSEAPT